HRIPFTDQDRGAGARREGEQVFDGVHVELAVVPHMTGDRRALARVRDQVTNLLVVHAPVSCGVHVDAMGETRNACSLLRPADHAVRVERCGRTSHDSHAEHVLHGVAACRTAGQPAGRDECAFGEEGAVLCLVRDLEPLAKTEEMYPVLARDRTAAQCMNADLALRSLARLTAAAVPAYLLECGAAPARDRRRERECRTARRVHLATVVDLDDLRVIRIRAEHTRGL